jgi:hypothetical protein
MHGQTSSIFPLRESGADVVRRNSASVQAQMCGTDCCHAQPCLHVTTHLRIGLLPFSCKFHCQSFRKGFSSSSEQSVHREHERCEMTGFSRQAPRYFRFFSFSCDSDTLNGVRLQQDFESVSVTQTSRMESAPAVQNPLMSRSPLSSCPVAASLSLFWVVILSGEVFTFSLAQPWMRGSSRAAEGVKALLAKLTSSSRISSCLKITRPPFLHPSACCREKWASQPSHLSGKLCGVSACLIDNASWNSCAESTVPFTVEGRTESHAPVSFPLEIVRLFSAVIGRKRVASFSSHNA